MTFLNTQCSGLNVFCFVFSNIAYYITKDWIMAGRLPVNASVVVVPIEELDLLKGLLAGVVTGQVRVHAKKQVQRSRPWEGNNRTRGGKKMARKQ